MICCTRRVSRRLSVCMRPENRTTASGSSFASATASANRFRAPIGRLELVADVGDEVTPDRLDPLLVGAVVGQDHDQPRRQRGDPRVHVGGVPRRWSSMTSASRTWPSRRTWRTSVMSSSGSRSSRTRPIATAGADAWSDGVVGVDEHGGRGQHGQHGLRAGGHDRRDLGHLGLTAFAVAPQPRHQGARRGADDSGDQQSCTGVHSIDRRAPFTSASPSGRRLTCAFRSAVHAAFTASRPSVHRVRLACGSCVISTTNSSTRSSTTS